MSGSYTKTCVAEKKERGRRRGGRGGGGGGGGGRAGRGDGGRSRGEKRGGRLAMLDTDSISAAASRHRGRVMQVGTVTHWATNLVPNCVNL